MRSIYSRLSETLKQNRKHKKYQLWYKRTALLTPVLTGVAKRSFLDKKQKNENDITSTPTEMGPRRNI